MILAIILAAAAVQGEYTVLFTQNHNEGYDIWGKDVTGFLEFSRVLEDEGFTITALNQGEISPQDLVGVDAVVVSYPEEHFTLSEIEVLEDYVKGGGSLIVFGGLDTVNQTNNVISRFGFNLNPTLMTVNGSRQFSLDVPSPSSHPILTFVERFEQIYTPTVKVTGERVVVMYPHNGFPEKDREGLFVIKEVGNGKVLVTGDADFLNNHFLFNYDNAQLGINIVSYMTGRPIEKIERGERTIWPFAAGVGLVLIVIWSLARWKKWR